MITSPSPPLLLLLLLPSLLPPFATAVDTLPANQPMSANQSLVSARGTFKLGFFSPGDPKHRYLAIWYNEIPVLTAVWVANRQSALPESGGSLVLTANGSLVLSDNTGVVRWSSGGAGTTLGVPVATLLDSGNLVVKDGKGSVVWQSFDYPTDRMLSGMKLGRDLRTGLDRQFTTWAAVGDPTPGPYRMAMDIHGVPEVFLFSSSVKKWRSGPWNGERFSGILTMTEYDIFTYKYIADENEISYMYEVTDPLIITHLYVNPIGTVERLVWLDQPSYWHAIQFTIDQCDLFNTCGAFGFCNSNTSPVCNCLQGFTPRSPRDWSLRDGTAGCVRETTLDCHNGTDGFVVVSDVKLPDTSNATVDYRMSLDECRSACLANCACTAYAASNISGSVSGCIIWMGELTDMRMYMNRGQDIYVRLAAKDLDSGSSGLQKRTIWIITVASVVLGAIFIGWAGCLLWKQKKRREMLATSRCMSENYSMKGSLECEFELPLFEFDTVVAATNYFSFHNKLGEGGFGPVYKGKLDEGKDVAIKRLERSSRQGMDEFKNEVMLIAKLQHRNLVRLFGYCVQGEERLLIYEYMPNGSLDAFLFDKEKAILLDWRTRYEIITGIARGLTYLHQDSRFRIIHRDLKASNILLDGEMNPKISDFGMARIFGGDETEEKTRRIVGTYGYMSPEYAMDGMFSVKSDVYSFGVLVLEIISGERNRGIYHADQQLKNLVGLTWSLWKEGKSLEIVDKSIQRPFPNVEVLKCIKLGLLCIEERPTDRPTMSSVVFMLGSDGASLPHPRRPGFAMMRGPKESPSHEEASCGGACNSIMTTTIECR